MLTIVGFVVLAFTMVMILRDKWLPMACFVVFPIVGALICGFSIKEIADFIKQGVGTVWATAALLTFSVIFFSIMNEVGLFDPIVNYLIKISRGSVALVYLATCLVATLTHLDGATTTTFMITIPAMLPIYHAMGLSPYMLLLLCGAASGTVNMVPWGGPTIRAANVLGMDVNDLWLKMLPVQIIAYIIVLVLAFLVGKRDQRALANGKKTATLIGALPPKVEVASTEAVAEGEAPAPAEAAGPVHQVSKTIFYLNYVLTVAVIFLMVKNWLPSYAVFFIGAAIALVLNYGSLLEQNEVLKRNAGAAILMLVTTFAAGVFLGVMTNSGMITAMAQFLISIFPSAVMPFFHWIFSLLSLPMAIVLGADTMYYGVLPLLIEVVQPFGVEPVKMALAMLWGHNLSTIVCTALPSLYLAMGLANVELSTHLKFSVKYLWVFSAVVSAIAIIMGVM